MVVDSEQVRNVVFDLLAEAELTSVTKRSIREAVIQRLGEADNIKALVSKAIDDFMLERGTAPSPLASPVEHATTNNANEAEEKADSSSTKKKRKHECEGPTDAGAPHQILDEIKQKKTKNHKIVDDKSNDEVDTGDASTGSDADEDEEEAEEQESDDLSPSLIRQPKKSKPQNKSTKKVASKKTKVISKSNIKSLSAGEKRNDRLNRLRRQLGITISPSKYKGVSLVEDRNEVLASHIMDQLKKIKSKLPKSVIGSWDISEVFKLSQKEIGRIRDALETAKELENLEVENIISERRRSRTTAQPEAYKKSPPESVELPLRTGFSDEESEGSVQHQPIVPSKARRIQIDEDNFE